MTPGPTPTATKPATAPSLPAAAPSLPAPKDFVDTCRLERSVCTPGDFQPPAPFPPDLQRPLALPTLSPGQPCPSSASQEISNGLFGGTALGTGVVRPIVGAPISAGRVSFRFDPLTGWYSVKTLWFSDPTYQGPAMMRGARLDGPGGIVLGEQPTLSALVIPPGDTLNGRDGWREAPGGTYIKALGCYGWQVDVLGSSTLIFFQAVAQ
jgi:hypothetical protein